MPRIMRPSSSHLPKLRRLYCVLLQANQLVRDAATKYSPVFEQTREALLTRAAEQRCCNTP